MSEQPLQPDPVLGGSPAQAVPGSVAQPLAGASPLGGPTIELEPADLLEASSEAGAGHGPPPLPVPPALPSQAPASIPQEMRSASPQAPPPAQAALEKKAFPEGERAEEAPRRRWIGRGLSRSFVAFLVSMLAHLVAGILLALWMVPQRPSATATTLVVSAMAELEEIDEAELETVVLDEQSQAATRLSFATPSGDSSLGVQAVDAIKPSEVRVDDTLRDNPLASLNVDMGGMLDRVRGKADLMTAVPRGTSGVARQVVDGYQEAIDRITQEIMIMLQESKVLVIWCFDQSESMKDDQKEIRDRIERVYQELGLSDQASGDALTTAVVSYGEGFLVHTKLPTSDRQAIREAIDAVPMDRSGKEYMCQAVARAIVTFRSYAVKTRRRTALILVTDESGEREDNLRFLEPTIAEAKAARCRVYVLGREAVFGYPYAHIRFVHPQTKRIHWLRIDRGPETAFVEQLQTDGFHRRYDAHPSGFGPYEQSRLARETGGIFFLLPSIESNLVRGEKRRYELEAMKPYLPDLRAREEIIFDRNKGKLRTMLWTVICDLDPYNKQSARVIEMRVEFSINPGEFVRQAAMEQGKAKLFITYLDEAAKQLEKIRPLRDKEPSPRWRANYDLMYAQLIAYKVRLYEYGAALEDFIKKPTAAPRTRPPNLMHTHWDITTCKRTLTGALTARWIERADALLNEVITTYPGTPWAARAQWELARGYGVQVVPDYEPPYPKVENPTPLPNL